MSRPDGYEELGEEPLLPPSVPAPGPTITQTAAPSASQQQQQQQQQHGAPPPARGVPAFPPLAHQALGGSRLEQLPPFPQYLAELPSAGEEWERSTLLFSLWLGCSAATLALALLTLNLLGTVGALCGTVGAAAHRFARLRAALTLADAINKILRLAIAAACLTGVVAGTSALIALGLSAACSTSDDKPHCAELAEVTTLFALWYSAYAGLSVAAARRAAHMRRLLNPVSSGAVAL